jgi:hypothetical protein
VSRVAAALLILLSVVWSQSAPITFVDVAQKAGLTQATVFGGEKQKRYILETTGGGVAFFDFDNDDQLDIFVVNGTRVDGKVAATNRLYRNKRDGTFEDVSTRGTSTTMVRPTSS